MDKKSIWIIIGLMSTAVVGLLWLQVNWINYALRLNEEAFNNQVQLALDAVSQRLTDEEELNIDESLDNGYLRLYQDQQVSSISPSTVYAYQEESLPLGVLTVEELQIYNTQKNCEDCKNAPSGMCKNCETKRNKIVKKVSYNDARNLPLVERINLATLKRILSEELQDHAISTEYKYGIFSKGKESFIIADDHYVVEESRPSTMKEGYKNLYNSEYKVNLFKLASTSPGMLMIYFPNKASFVWSSVIKPLVATILFTSLILFCFIYTVQVVFKQKKVSMMKSDFINNMTHEFKTPIATISLAADSITSPVIAGNAEKVKRFASIIKQENKRMNNQVEKVLQMAQIGKQKFSLKITNVNLHEVINAAVENIGLTVEKRGGNATADLRADNTTVEGDLTHISNIINNLLDNANKYTQDAPEIVVSTRNVKEGVEVTVKDNGVGLTKEARRHIFDKFYRVHTGNLHDIKGFGLGLAYVKAMMDAHKGQIMVKSEPGKGSEFILTFPYHQEGNVME